MLLVNDFKQGEDISEFDKSFIRRYSEESEEGYFLEVDVQYHKKLHDRLSDLPFLPERMKIEKLKKLIAYLHDKPEYLVHIRKFKLYKF